MQKKQEETEVKAEEATEKDIETDARSTLLSSIFARLKNFCLRFGATNGHRKQVDDICCNDEVAQEATECSNEIRRDIYKLKSLKPSFDMKEEIEMMRKLLPTIFDELKGLGAKLKSSKKDIGSASDEKLAAELKSVKTSFELLRDEIEEVHQLTIELFKSQ